MKTQHINKKLVLKKDTISNLNKADQEAIRGGIITLTSIQQTCFKTFCTLTDIYCC